jgi:hypothetical protein
MFGFLRRKPPDSDEFRRTVVQFCDQATPPHFHLDCGHRITGRAEVGTTAVCTGCKDGTPVDDKETEYRSIPVKIIRIRAGTFYHEENSGEDTDIPLAFEEAFEEKE